jgi:hypothetical protein
MASVMVSAIHFSHPVFNSLIARIARLYSLGPDELRYILDPHDVYSPDFPGETFRALREKETRLYGEYRTRRLVLEAWDAEDDTMTR